MIQSLGGYYPGNRFLLSTNAKNVFRDLESRMNLKQFVCALEKLLLDGLLIKLFYTFQIEEVPGEFTQDDLAEDDVMLLDAWEQVKLYFAHNKRVYV